MRISEVFHGFAKQVSVWVGTPGAFLGAVITVILWGASGPVFGYSDSWQLIINTGTTIITFLMVFLIQNTQNRDAKAIHLKLDELIHKLKGPRNSLIDLEHCTDEELDQLQSQFETMRHRVRNREGHTIER